MEALLDARNRDLLLCLVKPLFLVVQIKKQKFESVSPLAIFFSGGQEITFFFEKVKKKFNR